MPRQTADIQVPDRLADEPDASAEQLQVIRQLVTGMSLTGFRFDYRKLGSDQAAAVIDQLLKIRDAQGMTAATNTGRGCLGTLGAFIRGLGTVVISLLVLGVIGGGVFIYFNAESGNWRGYLEDLADRVGVELDLGSDSVGDAVDEESPAGEADPNAEQTDGDSDLVDSPLFEGLKVDGYPTPGGPDENSTRDKPDSDRHGDSGDTGTARTGSGDGPNLSTAARREIDAIELMLVQFSQFTRTDYSQSIRQSSVEGMNNHLAKLSTGMQAIEQREPALADRIKALVEAYGQEQINGQVMRDEVNAIREAIEKLKS